MGTIEVLNQEEIEKIVRAAKRVAIKVGMRIDGTDDFFSYLEKYGCKITKERTYFPEEVIENVFKRINKEKKEIPPPLSSEIRYGASGQGLLCCDVEDDRIRATTTKDLADFSRVVEAIPNLNRYHPTFLPQDVPPLIRDINAYAAIILNSSKPYTVSVYSEKSLKYFIQISEVFYGSLERVKEKAPFALSFWVNSPFTITKENILICMEARKILGRPLSPAIMPVVGASAPVTLAGSLAQQTAEVLLSNAITLAVDDRVCGYCSCPSTMDMSGVNAETGPETILMKLGSSQIADFIFGGRNMPSLAPRTSAKIPGAQSMLEKSIETTIGILAGTKNFNSLALLSFADIGSTVQLMLDVEMMKYFQHLLSGIKVDKERLAEEVIYQIAPKGAHFLESEHTLNHFREEQWFPELIDRRVPGAWIKESITMVDNARKKAKKLIREAPNKCPLSEEKKREIKKILKEAEKEMR